MTEFPSNACFEAGEEGCVCHWPAGPLPRNIRHRCPCCTQEVAHDG